jgi:hypothetical protein
MTDTRTIWGIMWAAAIRNGGQPFEIDEIVPEICERLKISEHEAKRTTGMLLKELERIPEGEQFFTLEGNAIVPLEEFIKGSHDAAAEEDAYPFEV